MKWGKNEGETRYAECSAERKRREPEEEKEKKKKKGYEVGAGTNEAARSLARRQ